MFGTKVVLSFIFGFNFVSCTPFVTQSQGKIVNVLMVMLMTIILNLKQRYASTCLINFSGQSYKASTIVIYDSRGVPDLKIPHITTIES